MNKAHIEAACWRIWYRLREKDMLTRENLMSNCGMDESTFEDAIDTLITIRAVETAFVNDGEKVYKLADNQPRMMQVFPTLWSGKE